MDAHEVAADMIRVIVGDECAGQTHVVGGQNVRQFGHVIRRVNDHGVAGLAIADEVDEVGHLMGRTIVLGEVTPR